MRRLFLFVPAGLLAGCQSEESARPRLAVLQVAYVTPDTCRLSIDNSSFSFPADENDLLKALKQRAKTDPQAEIKPIGSVPYKCFGGAIVLAQRAGFRRVGFIAEPPPNGR